jgi:S1-C subfamily serine protease
MRSRVRRSLVRRAGFAAAAIGLVTAAAPAPARSSGQLAAVTVRLTALGGGRFDFGSGVLLADGVVLAARHSTETFDVVRVERCGRTEVDAALVMPSRRYDATLVLVPSAATASAALATRDPARGDRLLLGGYPAGSSSLVTSTVTVRQEYDGNRFGTSGPLLGFTPAPTAGQSGGPLLDSDGRVAAIVLGVQDATGIGLAVPASSLRRAVGEALAPRIGALVDAAVADRTHDLAGHPLRRPTPTVTALIRLGDTAIAPSDDPC